MEKGDHFTPGQLGFVGDEMLPNQGIVIKHHKDTYEPTSRSSKDFNTVNHHKDLVFYQPVEWNVTRVLIIADVLYDLDLNPPPRWPVANEGARLGFSTKHVMSSWWRLLLGGR